MITPALLGVIAGHHSCDTDLLLRVDFTTDSDLDLTCVGTPTSSIYENLTSAAVTPSGLTFTINQDSSVPAAVGVRYQNEARFFDDPTTGWTAETLFTAALTPGAAASQGAYVFYISSSFSYQTSSAASALFDIRPGLQTFRAVTQGQSAISGSYTGSDVHVAITYTTADKAKVWVNGTLAGSWPVALTNLSIASSVVLGGGVLISPFASQGGVDITYKGVRLTRGIKYSSTFTPPTSL